MAVRKAVTDNARTFHDLAAAMTHKDRVAVGKTLIEQSAEQVLQRRLAQLAVGAHRAALAMEHEHVVGDDVEQAASVLSTALRQR